MRKQFGSIRFRIVAIVVLFTLASAAASVTMSTLHFRRTARQNLLQSAEFNLNLVAGLVSQKLDALSAFRDWCSANSLVIDYVSGSASQMADGVRTVAAMNEEMSMNWAYQYLLRAVAVSPDYQHILQCGQGATAGVPLTPYTIDRLERLEYEQQFARWSGVVTDPFTDVRGIRILYTCAPIRSGNHRRNPQVGTMFVMVNTALITDPMNNYPLPDGCALWLTVGEQSFALDDDLTPIDPPLSSEPTQDEPLNDTIRINRCTGADGDSFLSVSCPVGSSGLWLTQTISSQALTASFQGLYGGQLLLLILCSALIGAVVLYVLSRSINRPILRLQSRMDLISQGDFSPDPTIEWDNELGDVGRGINHLSQSVQGLMERRLADEKARQDLEYQMLQSQINPHFLYNSLNSIKWMATIQSADGIAEMTGSLAHLLKSIAKGQQTLIPLSEELGLLRDYFVIQKYRYGGAISMTEEVELGVETALLPRFTLQPLLENAIFHGIEPKGGAGTVALTARRVGEDLEITIADDGVGMDPGQAGTLLREEGAGAAGMFKKIGLSNVHRRIQYEFGPDYGLFIHSEPGQFTRVTVRLPLTQNQPEREEETG